MIRWTGIEVAALRAVHGLSQVDFAAKAGIADRTVGYWEQGKATAVLSPRFADMMETLLDWLDEEPQQRFYRAIGFRSDGTPMPLDQDTVNCAADSVAFAEWVANDDPGLIVTNLADQLASIAQRFVYSAPQPLLHELATLRDRVKKALCTQPSLHRKRELLFLAGVSIELLAQVTDNLGDATSAMEHAMAAELLARKAGHDGLRAWSAGTRALIAEWNNNPSAAMQFAREASTWAPPGQHQVRLAALEARCCARLGRTTEARAAIHRAERAADNADTTDELAAFGGSMRFPTTKLAYYIGSTYRLIQDYPQAEQWALDAITGYTSGPEESRSYGDEAIARTDVAIARILTGAVDGACEILVPVFTLQPDQRIYPIVDGMNAVDGALHTTRDVNASIARNLSQEIAMFTANELPALR
ncbi:helix-turn-helix domain-containing protein [Nocardia altamirensis]|uniref:helix-turn-helix domain-containing protein n=1 Tax=Nocardia altamirensis TaxID=472158 RepID=UPI00083FE41C|nr:helix-turn-helix domain-containing protein [Nocardia altamirensis]